MARIKAVDQSKVFNTSRFLGLHENEDGKTGLKHGEAVECRNWRITDDYHLKARPGTRTFCDLSEYGEVLTLWTGTYRQEQVTFAATTHRLCQLAEDGTVVQTWVFNGELGAAHIFQFNGEIYVMDGVRLWKFNGSTFNADDWYVPTILISADPKTGFGTQNEQINRLSRGRTVQYNGDGETTNYVLPETAALISSVRVDGEEESGGWFMDTDGKSVVFSTAPADGLNNVEITYYIPVSGDDDAYTVGKMRFSELYNGTTDSRVFLYGDGTNRVLYSGVTAAGEATADYFPALNELVLGDDDEPVTALIRHYSRLLAYKRKGLYTISYDTLTTTDGETIAGFYVRPMNRDIGNEAPGQVRQVYNFPRSIFAGTLYDWKQSASFYRDERYAKVVSDRVTLTARQVDPQKCYAFDDQVTKEYWLCFNDDAGTVLLHNYTADAWYTYTGLKNVTGMARSFGKLLMATADGLVLEVSDQYSTDNGAEIESVWKSGFLDFGMDYMRKNASEVWIILKPEGNTGVEVTAHTDKRTKNKAKTMSLATFANLNFAQFSFGTNYNPQVSRLKLKVKKFVFYQIELKSVGYSSRTVVLAMDHRVRYTTPKK